MGVKSRLFRILPRLRQFCTGQTGNVAVTFALACIPLVGAVGVAIDYSRANDVRTKLQQALDSTALLISKEAATVSNSQLQSDASSDFLSLFNPPGVQNIAITATYSNSGGSSVVLNASAEVQTTLTKIFGYNTIKLGSTSTVKWGSTRLRVALVLDNTGSMHQANKMNSLQSATNDLLSQFSSIATNADDIYVSIIPFVKDVNVGAANYTASWLDWTDFDANSGYCTVNKDTNKTKTKCLSQKGQWVIPDHSAWNGCVSDRGDSTQPDLGNYDTNVDTPTTSITATLFSPDQNSACPQEVMPLSNDWSAMTTVVNNMTPNGTTNQAIGLVHGWMSLVGGGPYPAPPPMDPGYKYLQFIILLTDGLNTEDRWYSNQGQIDARQQLTCNNIKNASITLYTIQVNTGKDPVSTLLQNCASSSDKFFYLTSASQISSTFQKIATQMSKLRIAN